MTWQSFAPGALPTTTGRDDRPHVCGLCRNPTGVYNPECPNRPRSVRDEPWE